MPYNNEIKTIKAKTKEDNPNLALLFEENYNIDKPDWRVISSEKRSQLRQYFERISVGDKVEVGFSDKGHIIFLRAKESGIPVIKEDFSDIKESSLPKANGNSKDRYEENREGAAFGLACHLAQEHLSWFVIKAEDGVVELPEKYWENYEGHAERYFTTNKNIFKRLKEAK